MKFKRPPILEKGDKVAILSPSTGLPYVFPWVYQQGLTRIKEVFELDPVEFPSALQTPEFLSENPKARADDINAAFNDPSIKAIISTIGGNDQIRILPYLNKEIITSNPKIFMGYSDSTNLHLFLWNLGFVSFYGGAVMTQFARGGGMQDYTVDSINKVLFTPGQGEVFAAKKRSDIDLDWSDPQDLHVTRNEYESEGWLWHNALSGIIQGQLWGGCLETLSFHLSVKRYLPLREQLDGAILYVETSEEMPSDGFVYRFFAGLGEMELLNRFKAILVAYPKTQFCGMQPPEGSAAFLTNQQNAIKKALMDYKCDTPVVFNMNFGHTDPQLIIPNGARATINFDEKRIFFD